MGVSIEVTKVHNAAGEGRNGTLATSIDVVYPKSNRRLFRRVVESGTVVSEYYLGQPPLAWRFSARNRIIAELADAVVVVEAPEKRGALITACHALEAGRDVRVAPGPVGLAECRGSNALLADGAGVIWDVDLFVDTVAPSQGTLQRLSVSGGCAGSDRVARERPWRSWG